MARTLSYLTAVLQEGMRLCPPIPANLHSDVPAWVATITGRWLLGGTAVGVPCYSMFRSEESLEKPENFITDRWLEGDGLEETRKRHFIRLE